MNIENDYVTGIDEVTLSNSLNASLIYLKLKVDADTVIPTDNNLIIYVDKNSKTNPSQDKKTYIFSLPYTFSLNSEFIIDCKINNNFLSMVSYVNINGEITELGYQPINLFEGTNYIYTNYDNIGIELIYPENNDLNKRYVFTSLYNEIKEDGLYYDYIKNSFTKDLNGTNLSINNVSANCITNPNNNFGIDSDGNIVAKSLTLSEGGSTEIDYDEIFDKIYPVGSIYLSINDVNPGTIFTGVWEQFAIGRTLVGVDNAQSEFNTVLKTGGHKELQSHSHNASIGYAGDHQHTGNTLEVQSNLHTTTSSDCARNINSSYDHAGVTITNVAGNHTHSISVTNSGNGDSGNLQPYVTCYIWRRTS